MVRSSDPREDMEIRTAGPSRHQGANTRDLERLVKSQSHQIAALQSMVKRLVDAMDRQTQAIHGLVACVVAPNNEDIEPPKAQSRYLDAQDEKGH